MKASRYIDRELAPPGKLQLLAAILSFLVVLTRGAKAKGAPQPAPLAENPHPAPAQTAQQISEPATSLRGEPRPKALLQLALSAVREWVAHRAASKGAALALYTLFSLAPMLVLVVTLAGLFFGQDAVRDELLKQMSGLMGTQGGEGVRTILAGARQENAGVMAGLISAGLVLVSATSAFAELKDSLDELWEVPPSGKTGIWGLLRERLLSFGLILVIALMLLISLAVSTALAAMDSIWPGGEGSPLKILSVVISNLMSFAIVTALFAVIFKYLPATKIAWKDVLVGAFITAALFIIGKALIGLYVARTNVSSAYGAAGSVVILILWVYYSAQIFFYGALFTHEYAMKLGSRAQAPDKRRPEGR